MEEKIEIFKKDKARYHEYIAKAKEERNGLMEQVKEMRQKKGTLTEKIDIAKLEFEESKLVQEISNLTGSIKSNELTIERIQLEQDILESKIDKETYAKGKIANKKAIEDSSQEEYIYCENEVNKCEKAIRLYTLLGDTQSVKTWSEALEKAQKQLSVAKQDLKDQTFEIENNEKQEKQEAAPYINEFGEIIRPDNTQKEVDTNEQHDAGYTRIEENGVMTEEINQVLKDYSGKEIGSRTIIDKDDFNNNGVRTLETTTEIENEDGKYTIYELGRTDEDGEVIKKEMMKDNKITGTKEELSYQKDEKGEMYTQKVNGQITFKINKTDIGISIDEYRNGQPYATYEYDENGKAIEDMGMGEIEQLEENYVENFFDSQVPYYEAENRDLPEQDKSKTADNETLFNSAIDTTEETTRTSTINEQVENIKKMQKEKTQQQDKTNNEMDR